MRYVGFRIAFHLTYCELPVTAVRLHSEQLIITLSCFITTVDILLQSMRTTYGTQTYSQLVIVVIII